MDAVCDGQEMLIPGIMEHIERAVSSGIASPYIPQTLVQLQAENRGLYYPDRKAAFSKGLINIQFVVEKMMFTSSKLTRSAGQCPHEQKSLAFPW